MNLPYAFADQKAFPMTIKSSYEDFFVEELLLYEASGQGDHLFFEIEKKGMSTMEAIQRIAKVLQIPRKTVGFAGLKDAYAVTRQTLSVEHVPEEKLKEINEDSLKVLRVQRHQNKLKVGHLKGNHFILKLRDFDLETKDEFEKFVHQLCQKGVPNYFGVQRFGRHGDTWKIGKAILEADFKTACLLIAGGEHEGEFGVSKQARNLFNEGKFKESADCWPRGHQEAAQISRVLARSEGNYRKAMMKVNKKMLKFYLSAFQSHVFNAVLAERIYSYDSFLKGDWAQKHHPGGLFFVEDVRAENLRAAAFEISPTGPIYGRKMESAQSDALELENEVCRMLHFSPEIFMKKGYLACQGERRSLRFKPENVCIAKGEDQSGSYLEFRFVLPAGCYATSFMRELGQDSLRDASLQTSNNLSED
jgi:tRNA pseudouridine13 synthase